MPRELAQAHLGSRGHLPVESQPNPVALPLDPVAVVLLQAPVAPRAAAFRA